MSEQLKPYEMMHKDPIGGTMINSLWYRKQDADAALAAKDAEINRLVDQVKMLVRQSLPLEPVDGLEGWSQVLEAHQLADRLAAKDARIAELEQSQGAEVFLTLTGEISKLRAQLASQQQAEPCEDMAEQLERAEIRMMFGDAQEPATPSEDGRDSVQVVAFLIKPDFYEPYVSLHRDSQTSALCEPLMTVAQHERIVAALHCELATFKQVNLDMGSELREHRQRAQPARQVGEPELISYAENMSTCTLTKGDGIGYFYSRMTDAELDAEDARQVGDEQIKNDSDALVIISRGVLAAAIYAIREKKDAPVIIEKLRKASIGDEVHYAALAPVASQVGGDEQRSAGDAWLWHALRSQYGDESQAEEGFYAGWKAHAALAPAAACVVPPYADLDDHPVADIEYQRDVGWNMALAKVARLNRRAIPEGLLERIAKMPSSPEAEMDRYEACDELRSLLSQQQEGGV